MSIWNKYQKSQRYLEEHSVITNARWFWNMYLGNQWDGVKTSTKLPVMNIIKQVVDYKAAAIGQNQMVAVFSDADDDYTKSDIYKALNSRYKKFWKKSKMDHVIYQMIIQAGVQGDAYLYFGDTEKCMLMPDTAVLLADEQEPDIQKQPYVMVRYRPFVSDVKDEARRNGVPEEDVSAITGDKEPDYIVGNKYDIENDGDDAKCTAVIYFEKDPQGNVLIGKATKGCEFRPLAPLSVSSEIGETFYTSKLYPIVKLPCQVQPNNARGRSWVEDMIPNQIELNKAYAKTSAALSIAAYPRVAYNSRTIRNPEDLDKTGAPIEIDGDAQSISSEIAYLQGVPMSGDVFTFLEDIFTKTKMVAGASDAITGISDPTRVSGSAISEIREQSTLTLKGNVIMLKQCYEDIANVMLDGWKTYQVDGFSVRRDPTPEEILAIQEGQPVDLEMVVSGDMLREIEADIEIDVTLRTESTKDATQGILDVLRDNQMLTFEEWVEASDEQGTVPKERLQKIISERSAQQLDEANIPEQGVLEGLQ